jgi:hypothetical protein
VPSKAYSYRREGEHNGDQIQIAQDGTKQQKGAAPEGQQDDPYIKGGIPLDRSTLHVFSLQKIQREDENDRIVEETIQKVDDRGHRIALYNR